MRIPTITEAYSAELRKTDNQRRTEKPSSKGKAARPDRSDFSSAGQRLSETKGQADVVAAQMKNAPDIRPEKIAEVKRKIAEGFYDSEDLKDKLADKLLSEFGLKGPSAEL